MQHKIVIHRHRPWLKPVLIAGVTGALALGAWALYSFTRATTVSDFQRTQTEVERLRADRRQLSHDLRTAREIEQLKGQVVYSKRSSERSEEHTSELQSLIRISYAVFCLKKQTS